QLDLPVPLAERRLALSSEMPAVVKPGDIISYTLAVENTSAVTQSLAIEDRLPAGGKLLACLGQCVESRPGVVRWEVGPLAPGKQVSTTVKVHLSMLTPPVVSAVEPPGAAIEHTASLLDSQGNVLNVDTLSVPVGTATSQKWIASQDKQSPEFVEGQSNYFFVYDNQGVAEGDGLVQEIVSPWSSNHVAIVVTGLDEKALLKAAQALSTDDHFPGMWGPYAIVQSTHPISESAAVSFEDMSLASLGYDDGSINSLHLEYFEHKFHVAPGWNLSDDAYLALHLAHGAALSDIQATLEVQLNDLPIGGIPLDKSNAYNSWTAFPLPATASQTGSNRIRVQVSADIEDKCRYITNDRYWLTVYADSFLHLPRQAAGLMLDLDNFPYPFSNHPGLGDIVFLLTERPALVEIESMLRLASQLGSVASGDVFLPQVALGGQPDAESWAGYHLIAVGLPTNNRYLAAANDTLPQPFRPGTNEILQEIDRVVYRLPPGVSLGYVQELPSPWNKDRAMLAVTGTTDEGVAWALTALTDDQLQRQLAGNLALIRDREVRSIDTREKTADDVVAFTRSVAPGMTPIIMPAPTPTATISPTPTAIWPTPMAMSKATSDVAPSAIGRSRPVWVMPLLILSALTVLIAVGIAIWQSRS
ncbi:MAG: cellulose biosynthesis cyclic di-GMP-binding regulatory protein BcsB, partial [Anaerolineae bacterium]